MITAAQQEAITDWIALIAKYPPEADVIVAVTGLEGGAAEVRVTPEGKVWSTTSDLEVEV